MVGLSRPRVVLYFGKDELPAIDPTTGGENDLFEQSRRLLELAVSPAALRAAAGNSCKVAFDLETQLGNFVCCDRQQLFDTIDLAYPIGDVCPATLNAEVVVLTFSDTVKKLKRSDINSLIEGHIQVTLSTDGSQSTARCPFDKNRPPTLLELEDAIESAFVNSGVKYPENVKLTWSVAAPALDSRDHVAVAHTLDGTADVAALANDVRCYGFDRVNLHAVAEQSSLLAKPLCAPEAAAARKTTQPAKPTNVTTDRFDTEDTDIDYVAISYSINPPVITVIGFLGDENLATLCSGILDACVTPARVAMMRMRGGNIGFRKTPKNAGTSPVHVLELSKSYFDEAQEMQLAVTILDTMEHAFAGEKSTKMKFRYVPMDGMGEREITTTAEQRDRSKTFLNITAARAGADLASHSYKSSGTSKTSAQFFFILDS